MKAKPRIRPSRGYVSYVMVLSIGAVLTMLMVYTYRDASQSMVVTSGVQQRADFLSKEDAAMRSLLSIVPNRAIRAMQDGSAAVANTPTLTWQSIFQDALTQADADTAISTTVAATTNLTTTYSGNTGDSSVGDQATNNIGVVFRAIAPEQGFVASGCVNTLPAGFPPPLNTTSANVLALDQTYPIVSSSKYYGTYATGQVGVPVADYPQFNLIPYPKIDFGYAAQGGNFVAKRNWWAFTVNLYDHAYSAQTNRINQSRDYVLSLYEIPSQLAISADAFTTLGRHASGSDWGEEIHVEGQVFAGQADVQGSRRLQGLASRRGMSLSASAQIGDLPSAYTSKPFEPGSREKYLATGDFYPVSMSSETGRAAFVPINRGIEFYDRFAAGVWGDPSAVLSPTDWDNYSVGAQQCAMKLDVTGVVSATDQTPTSIRFTYKKGGVDAPPENIPYDPTTWATATPRIPFDVVVLSGSRPCLVFKPEYLKAYLAAKGGDDLSVNNSLAVNADYRTGSVDVRKPSFPCLNDDVALILNDCTDLTAFTKGFSLVTNLRLYIADDFNIQATTPPAGITGTFYPPTSLFAPERRFGSADEPWRVEHEGSVGSLAGNYQSGGTSGSVNLLDLKTGEGNSLAASNMTVNLRPVTHPGALPPINAMNWLIVLEEKR
jgi:hypothetical protein